VGVHSPGGRTGASEREGRKAELVKIQRLGEKADEKKADEKRVEKQEAAGEVAELGPAAIVVQGDKRLACRVPAEKQAKLDGLKVGDKVKIFCVGNVLAGLERISSEKPAGQEVRLYGRIVALSRAAVTVQGEAGSLTCVPPA